MKTELEQNDLRLIIDGVIEGIKPLILGRRNVESEEIFDTRKLAEYLQVKPSWVKKQIVEYGIPYFKVGKYVRFKKSNIDKWVNTQKIEPINSRS